MKVYFMMHLFLSRNRVELERRCREKVSARPMRFPNLLQLENGIPIFLDQIIRTLEAEEAGLAGKSLSISGSGDGNVGRSSELGDSAAIHGGELLGMGYSISQVVHDYGDLCQSVTELALDMDQDFRMDEFKTLNRCLDNGIAQAVTEFSDQRDVKIAHLQATELNERIGFFAHELRNHLNTAGLALAALKEGGVGLRGATGAVLDRSMVGLRVLIDRSLAEVRVGAGLSLYRSVFSLSNFIREVEHSAALEAGLKGCTLHVSEVSPVLFINADKDLLLSAVGNIVQNAFKFGSKNGLVSLRAFSENDRLKIEVEDDGEGIGEDNIKNIFMPFTQNGENKSGLGLGLVIAKKSIEANGGILSVRSIVGEGSTFMIDLPRCTFPA